MASIIKRTYRKTLPDGSKVTCTCPTWTIQYRDAAGRIKRVKGYRDKAATKALAAQMELAHARGEVGLIHPHKASLARPLKEHVDEYIADLQAKGRSAMYVYSMGRRLRVLMEDAGWATLKDITAESFVRWRGRAKQSPRRPTRKTAGGKKMTTAATTLNQYLDSARAFTGWCATLGRMPGTSVSAGKMIATALAGVDRVEGPATRVRRALTDDQVTSLLAAAAPGRRLAYRVAMGIGLRRGELKALQWGDLTLGAKAPKVQLRAEATKSSRADRLALPPSLAEDLAKAKPADATGGDRVFPRVPSLHWWKKDLNAAGIPYLDEQGRQVDFHGGTRKTLCTRMHRAGVPLAVAMRTMRHTDARLTMVDYADDEQLHGEAATAVLAELLPA